MFHKVFLGLIVLLFLTPILSAKTVGFEIEDFIPDKFEDFEWRLRGSLDLSNANTNQDYNTTSVNYSETNNVIYDLGLFSSQLYEKQSIEKNLRLGLNASIDFRNRNSESKIDRSFYNSYDNYYLDRDYWSNVVYLSLSPSISYDRYLKSDFFAGIEFKPSVNYQATLYSKENEAYNYENSGLETTMHDRGASSTEFENYRRIYNLNFSAIFGYGRTYVGYYAATAIYLVEELRKFGLLKGEPDDRTMKELAELIYYYRNKHAVDSRLLLIETYDEIMNLFKKNDLVEERGHYAVLIMQDVWNYFPNDKRYFGWKIQLKPGINYRYQSNQNSDDYFSRYTHVVTEIETGDTLLFEQENDYRYERFVDTKTEDLESYIDLLVEYHKPINFKWQLQSVLTFSYNFQRYRKNNEFSNRIYYDSLYNVYTYYRFYDYEDDFHVSFNNSLTYFKSSRTTVSSYLNFYYTHYKETQLVQYEVRESDDWRFRIGSTVSYRIAIPTTLNLSAGVNISEQINNQTDALDYESDQSDFYLRATIEHYIF